jgi:hypothetical protein
MTWLTLGCRLHLYFFPFMILAGQKPSARRFYRLFAMTNYTCAKPPSTNNSVPVM